MIELRPPPTRSLEVAVTIGWGSPVTAPGVPPGYPDPRPLLPILSEQARADAAHFYSAMEDSPPYGHT